MYYAFAILIIFTNKKTRKKYCQRLKPLRRNNKLFDTKNENAQTERLGEFKAKTKKKCTAGQKIPFQSKLLCVN